MNRFKEVLQYTFMKDFDNISELDESDLDSVCIKYNGYDHYFMILENDLFFAGTLYCGNLDKVKDIFKNKGINGVVDYIYELLQETVKLARELKI